MGIRECERQIEIYRERLSDLGLEYQIERESEGYQELGVYIQKRVVGLDKETYKGRDIDKKIDIWGQVFI